MYCTVGAPVINVAKLGDGQCVVRTGGGRADGGYYDVIFGWNTAPLPYLRI